MKTNISIILTVFSFLIFGCNNSENQKNEISQNDSVKNTGLNNNITLKIGQNITGDLTLNQEIEIKVEVEKPEEIDSIQLVVNNVQITSIKDTTTCITWNSSDAKTGNNTITAIGYFKGENTRVSKSVILLSDIEPAIKKYKVIASYKHDKEAYTQGLFVYKSVFYEATGLKGESSLRKTNIKTGEVIQSYAIPNDIFGEGITLFNNKIIQLSWQDHVAYIYNLETFEKTDEFEYDTEGWGLTNDGTNLIMSDGSNILYIIENQSYSIINQLEVYDNKKPVKLLNELEYIDGVIYANIYTTDKIAMIDAKSGKVLAYVDMTGLLPQSDYETETDVLNGIAYDFDTKKLYVTGKKWSKLFEIEIIN